MLTSSDYKFTIFVAIFNTISAEADTNNHKCKIQHTHIL